MVATMKKDDKKITKLTKLKSKNINLDIEIYENEKYVFIITLDDIIEPSPRPRSNNNSNIFYNPLESYIKFFRRTLLNYMNEYGFHLNEDELSGKVEVDLKIYKVPPLAWSQLVSWPILILWIFQPLISIGIVYRDWETDRKSTRLNSSHSAKSRMPSSA